MDIKYCPPNIFLAMVVISVTTFIGCIIVSAHLEAWYASDTVEFPLNAVFYGALFCSLPALALLEIFRRRVCGRYLGILSLMMVFGIYLRAIKYLVATTMEYRFDFVNLATTAIPTCAVLVALVSLIYSVGFSKKAADYFKF